MLIMEDLLSSLAIFMLKFCWSSSDMGLSPVRSHTILFISSLQTQFESNEEACPLYERASCIEGFNLGRFQAL